MLDIRGVFDRVSEIAGRVLAHDAMGLPILTEDCEHVIPLATAGLPAGALPPVQPVDDVMRWLTAEPWDWHILDDLHPASRRSHSTVKSVLREAVVLVVRSTTTTRSS